MKLPPRVVLASPQEILRWHARWRAFVAIVVAGAFATLQAQGWFTGEPRALAAILGGYLALVFVAAFAVSPARHASGSAVVAIAVCATVLADIAAMVAATAVAARDASHDWVLVVGFFFVHLAEYSFGRRASLIALVSTTAGYLLLYGMRADVTPAAWATAALAAGTFVAVAATFLAQYASRRRRLRGIIALFERAEDGDLSQAYDVARDCRPDAVTLLGGAYNRVRARFQQMVLTDALTSCLNRRGFEQALERELARAERASSEVAMLAIDIDYFKDVNDTHGHVAGDETLTQLGKLLLTSVRTGDIVGRVGGDEFVILCPDTGIEGAQKLGASLCEFVAAHVFDGHSAGVRITVSAGAAAIEATAADHTASELKLRADRALYDAKHAGRNRVQCWHDGTVVGRRSSAGGR